MRIGARQACFVAAALASGWAGCTPDEPWPDASDGGGDTGHESGSDVAPPIDVARDGRADSDGDGAVPIVPAPGPLTLVARTAEVLADRRCDHDGDGSLDNAVADLGPTQATLLVAALNSQLQGSIDEHVRIVAYFPWLDDAATPDDGNALMVMFEGLDTDRPSNPEDDFSGDEPLQVHMESLDSCGEPTFFMPSVRLDDGELSGQGGTIPVPLQRFLVTRGASVTGQLDPYGREAEIEFCSYVTIADAGASSSEEAGLSELELLLAGGAFLGVPTIPGLTPDVDLDGDGLERLELGETMALARCIDGDSTVIDGSDCWQDARMADAISVVGRLTASPAVFGGRHPEWQDHLEGSCDDGFPERSLFDAPGDAE